MTFTRVEFRRRTKYFVVSTMAPQVKPKGLIRSIGSFSSMHSTRSDSLLAVLMYVSPSISAIL